MKKSTNHKKYVKNDPVRLMLLGRFLSEVAEFVAKQKPNLLLDAGSGEGFVLEYLDKKNLLREASGLDISKHAVKIAQRKLPKFNFSEGSIYSMPYKDNMFDLVLCNEVLEHLDDPQQALKELRRVSKDYLVLSVPHEPWFMLGSLCGGKYIRSFGNHPEHVNHWSPLSFRRFLHKNGLNIVQSHVIGSFPWILVLCKKS